MISPLDALPKVIDMTSHLYGIISGTKKGRERERGGGGRNKNRTRGRKDVTRRIVKM
jgi:hypothetical protein